jgi:hypothetical protein
VAKKKSRHLLLHLLQLQLPHLHPLQHLKPLLLPLHLPKLLLLLLVLLLAPLLALLPVLQWTLLPKPPRRLLKLLLPRSNRFITML